MSRRRYKHPEARTKAILARVAEAAEGAIPPTGWRFPFGYLLRLYKLNGDRVFLQAPTYAEALKLRDELMLTGAYEKCWVEQRVE